MCILHSIWSTTIASINVFLETNNNRSSLVYFLSLLWSVWVQEACHLSESVHQNLWHQKHPSRQRQARLPEERHASQLPTSLVCSITQTYIHIITQRKWPLWDSLTLPPLLGVFRIVDNMPVTWCYDVEEEQKFCNPGFPIGCYVTETGLPKDACVVNVSSLCLDIRMELLAFNKCTFLILCL